MLEENQKNYVASVFDIGAFGIYNFMENLWKKIMDTMAWVALGVYVILFCMTFWVIKVYKEESAKVNKRLRTR